MLETRGVLHTKNVIMAIPTSVLFTPHNHGRASLEYGERFFGFACRIKFHV
jgi:hypothetical protein